MGEQSQDTEVVSTCGNRWTCGAAVVAHVVLVFTATIDGVHPAAGANSHHAIRRGKQKAERSAVRSE